MASSEIHMLPTKQLPRMDITFKVNEHDALADLAPTAREHALEKVPYEEWAMRRFLVKYLMSGNLSLKYREQVVMGDSGVKLSCVQ